MIDVSEDVLGASLGKIGGECWFGKVVSCIIAKAPEGFGGWPGQRAPPMQENTRAISGSSYASISAPVARDTILLTYESDSHEMNRGHSMAYVVEDALGASFENIREFALFWKVVLWEFLLLLLWEVVACFLRL